MGWVCRRLNGGLAAAVLIAAGLAAPAPTARAAEVVLNDGRILQGKLGMLSSLTDQPSAPAGGEIGPIQLIVMLDDDLRRTFFSKRLVQEVRQDNPGQIQEKFALHQRVLQAGPVVKSVGPAVRLQPFDEFGRRIFTFNTAGGPVDVIQGITLITPKWTKVEGISHIWDMRIATSSIPPDVLRKILYKQIDLKDVEQRKKIASFFIQSERYEDARQELEAIVKAFPDMPDLKEDLVPTIQALRQLGAQRLLSELRLRRSAGQHRMAFEKLQAFPSEDVAGEILQAVREMIEEYQGVQARGKEIAKQINALLAEVKDAAVRRQIEPIREEIFAELSINTLDRMAALRQSLTDENLLPEDKLSLGLSGWLLGTESATVKLPVALSLHRVRSLVEQYLDEPAKINREAILERLRSEEGAQVELVAALVSHMKPPLESPPPVSPREPGLYELETRGLATQPPVRYLVQLPPEYDPYRYYPAVITLHGAATTPAQQIDWWAGAWTPGGWRAGQATRQGYIVIAPQWTVEHQKTYNYSAREHAAVLGSLRDACKRFSIDTDRVFLSGHSIGGDAAWDMGLAHPDLWAGVIPIVARSDKYCALYWENARTLPFYFVGGELDGDKMTQNARDLDRYLTRHTFNCTIVEYQGRGHEHYYEEVLHLFEWMERFRRDFFPVEFTCSTMRRWDNFFWWVELQGMPARSMVDPIDWPPGRGSLPLEVTGRILENNGLTVRTGAAYASVWLAPEMVNFKERMSILVNGQRMNNPERFVTPDLETLLEDVRTRGDRIHPFWAKVEASTGRLPAAE